MIWLPELRIWWLSGHDEVRRCVADPRLSAGTIQASWDDPARGRLADVAPDLRQTFDRWMLYADGDEHRRLRRVARSAFTPRVMARIESEVRAAADDLVAAVAPAGAADLVAAVARPLPGITIARLLGVDDGRAPELSAWADDALAVIGTTDPALAARAEAAMAAVDALTREAVAQRGGAGGDDLLSSLVALQAEGTLGAEDVVATVSMLLVGGASTTQDLIGSCLQLLLARPDLRAEVTAEPGLVDGLVAEVVRTAGPVRMAARIAPVAMDVEGRAVEAGALLFCDLHAANRDPSAFADPDAIDLRRGDVGLGFGFGPHHCLGDRLARLEAGAVVAAALAGLAGAELSVPSEQVPLRASVGYHGPAALPARWPVPVPAGR